VSREVADQREMNPEPNMWSFVQQAERLSGARTRWHQAAGAGNPALDRAHHRPVDGRIHSEVIGTDDQQTSMWRITQEFAGEHRFQRGRGDEYRT
jgi:hypothetical protein